MNLFFLIVSTLLVISSTLVVLSKNTVFSVLFLIFSFFNAAIIFLISDAEFLAMTLIIVYVGAVAVLFLFVVMMININFTKLKEGFLKYLPFGLLLSFIFLTELTFIFSDFVIDLKEPKINIENLFVSGNSNTKSLGLFMYTEYFIIFQMSAYILLVAMIGAIVLAYEKKKKIKSQDIFHQNNIKKEDVIRLTDPNNNEK